MMRTRQPWKSPKQLHSVQNKHMLPLNKIPYHRHGVRAFLLGSNLPTAFSALRARSYLLQKYTEYYQIATHACIGSDATYESKLSRDQRIDIDSTYPPPLTEYLHAYPFPLPLSDTDSPHPHPAANLEKSDEISSPFPPTPRPTSLASEASDSGARPDPYFAAALAMGLLLPLAFFPLKLRLMAICTLLCSLGGWLALWGRQRWKQRDVVRDDVAAHEAGHLLL